jgi:hypothetical protein
MRFSRSQAGFCSFSLFICVCVLPGQQASLKRGVKLLGNAPTNNLATGRLNTDAITQDVGTPAVASKNTHAMAFLSQALQAHGSALAAHIADVQLVGTLQVQKDTLPITIKSKGTQMVRTEIVRASGTDIRILNGGRAAVRRADGSLTKLSMNNTLLQRASHIPVFSLLAEHQDRKIQVDWVGSTDGGTAVAMSFVPDAAAPNTELFRNHTRTVLVFDTVTGYLVKMKGPLWSENTGNRHEVEVRFSDYRVVNGIPIPFHQTTFLDGKVLNDLVVSSVSFNVGLSDSEFVVPGGN